jgi:metal transporter CNNM
MHGDEITMIEGALAMTTKVAADICTPLRRVYALPSDTVMDEDCMVKIWSRGFSRIPVYHASANEVAAQQTKRQSLIDVDTSSIIGVLLTRQLIVLNPEEKRPITTLPLAPPPCVAPSVHLVDLINLFQAGGGRGKPGLHLAIVCARPLLAFNALERGEPIPKECGVVGIVTLEDVVEELLQEEIYDEYDRDLELAQWGVDKWKQFVKRKQAIKSEAHTGTHFDSALVKKVVIASEMNTEVTPLLSCD